MKQYIYTVYEGKIHRAEVAKVTDQQVYLVEPNGGAAFGYARILPKYAAKWTPEDAVKAWHFSCVHEMDRALQKAAEMQTAIRSMPLPAWKGE